MNLAISHISIFMKLQNQDCISLNRFAFELYGLMFAMSVYFVVSQN